MVLQEMLLLKQPKDRNFLTENLKKSLSSNLLFQPYSLLLKKFKDKLDPESMDNFLDLNGPVVKSHGSTDALGFYSIEVCYKIAKGNMMKKIKDNLII